MNTLERIKELELEKANLEKVRKELEDSKIITLRTNTAFLLNSKVAEILGSSVNFKEWVEIKHEQHWKNLNDSIVEVTFKILTKEKETSHAN
jgi:hypothetical protein